MGKQHGFYFDQERCIGCQSCEVACKQFHGIKADTISYRKVSDTTNGNYPDVKRIFVNISCMHCGKPACVAVCPAKAISKRIEDGIVVVDQDKCIGCHACLSACPFGVPNYADGVMHKCDLCLTQNLATGSKSRCAAACTTQALQSGSMEELVRIAQQKAAAKISNATALSDLLS